MKTSYKIGRPVIKVEVRGADRDAEFIKRSRYPVIPETDVVAEFDRWRAQNNIWPVHMCNTGGGYSNGFYTAEDVEKIRAWCEANDVKFIDKEPF